MIDNLLLVNIIFEFVGIKCRKRFQAINVASKCNVFCIFYFHKRYILPKTFLVMYNIYITFGGDLIE